MDLPLLGPQAVCPRCQWALTRTQTRWFPGLWTYVKRAMNAWAAAVWLEAFEGLTVRKNHNDFPLYWTAPLRRLKAVIGDIKRVRRLSRRWCRAISEGRDPGDMYTECETAAGLKPLYFRAVLRCLAA